jgi:apolipoprotein N-acyltransferase
MPSHLFADRSALDIKAKRLAAALMSGVMLSLASSLQPWWPMAWIAPIPLLMAAFSAARGETPILAACAALIGSVSITSYYLEVAGTRATILITILRVAMMIIVVVAARAAVVRWGHWLAVFVYPALVAGLDTLTTTISRHGTAGSIAYSQMNALPVIQIASIAGTSGIVFVVTLFASTIAVAWYRRGDVAELRFAYVVSAIIIVGALGYGSARVAFAPKAPTVPVGLAVIDTATNPHASAPGDGLWATYGKAVAALAQQGAKIILLPEKIAAFDPVAADQMRGMLANVARTNRIYLVVGVTILKPDHSENRAWLFTPDGQRAADYSKQHLVPGFEDAFVPGREAAVRPIAGDQMGVAICKDMDFPWLGRDYASRGVRMMLVPGWDFGRDDWQHSRMSVLRGVEGGFSIARAARDGLLTVSDRYGRILGQAKSSMTPYAGIVVNATVGPGIETPYARFGDVFGWIALAFGVIASLWAAVRPKGA